MRKDIRYTSLLNSEEDMTDSEEDPKEFKATEYIPEKPSVLVTTVSIVSIALTYIGCFVYLAFFNVVDPSDLVEGKVRINLTGVPVRNVSKFWSHYFTEDEGMFLNCSEFIKGNQNATDLYVNNGRMKLDKERVFDLPMDCGSIRERVYGDMPPFKPLKRPIALVRTIYKMYELQEALFSMSYHPDNVFCYVMDSKSTDKLKKSMRVMSKCFKNVVVLEKEYNLTSGGHGQDPAHFDCLERILEKKWDHAVILQNYDLIIKTPYQLSDLSETLNYTSTMGSEYGFTYRYNFKADWTPAGMRLFKNATGVPHEILHKNLTVRKSLNEVMVSKIFVKSMFDKLNMTNILKLFDENNYYGVDEMLMPTLYENFLGLEGQMESNCTKDRWDDMTRWTIFRWIGEDGYDLKCKSKWKRHGVCIFGVEYLHDISKSQSLIANKVMSTFDFGTIICTREMIKNNTTAPVPNAQKLQWFPQFREMQLKAAGTYDKTKFDC